MKWQIHEARARFSEIVQRALREGPQMVAHRGKPIAGLISLDEYQRLRSGSKTFKTLLASTSLRRVEINRSRDTARITGFSGAKRKRIRRY